MPDYLPLLGVGWGAGLDPDAVTYWGPYAGSISAARLALDNQLFTDLKAAGLFAKFDCFYIFAHEIQALSYRNLIKRAHDCTDGVAPTWTQDRGIQGNGTTQYVLTNYQPNTHMVNLSLNSGTLVIYSRTNLSSSTQCDIGGRNDDNTNLINLFSRSGTNNMVGNINANSSNGSNAAIAESLGLFGVSRTASNLTRRYRNGSQVGSDDTVSPSAITNANVSVLARNSVSAGALFFSSRQIAMAGIGGGLSAAEQLALFNIIEPYMDAIGAGVA